MPFLVANIAEMMRSGQKDSELTTTSLHPRINRFVESLSKLYYTFFATDVDRTGSQFHIFNLDWGAEIELFTSLVYYLATTMFGQQTIGEEYVSIVQVDGTFQHHPRLLLRSLMTSLHCFGPYLLHKLVNMLKRYVNTNIWMAESRKPVVNDILNKSTRIIQWVYKLQRSLFFLQLSSENISKHLTAIGYVSIRRTPVPQYKWFTILGYLGVIQSIITLYRGALTLRSAVHNSKSKSRVEKSTEATTVNTTQSTCPLCYDALTNITSTACGHLFCWTCIYPWTAAKLCCPICRMESHPRDLIRLINFVL